MYLLSIYIGYFRTTLKKKIGIKFRTRRVIHFVNHFLPDLVFPPRLLRIAYSSYMWQILLEARDRSTSH